ncbi:hypothetical protein [Kineococcus glutinatus]|uniref:Uncharacterized protein n=1 Tax=Kineococcus glutinatus TaxID=1070872 RepID=A0ABP9HEK2_9ACTN
MAATRSEELTTGAVTTLVLAGSAALALGAADAIGFTTENAEAVFTVVVLLGWTLLVWAAIVGGLCVVQLLRRLLTRRAPAWPGVLLLGAGVAVIVAVVGAHPLWGSGSHPG